MRPSGLVGLLFAGLLLVSCNEKQIAETPPPYALDETAMGNYCGMNVIEHAGPKGQIILASRIDPVWFSSARDAFAFTMLPEEPKDIRAIYVSDMAKAQSWEKPGETNWVDARKAFFVLGSRKKGGMGVDETVPFSDRTAAERFAAEHGGRVMTFSDVPPAYVLSAESEGRPAEGASDSDTAAGKAGQSH